MTQDQAAQIIPPDLPVVASPSITPLAMLDRAVTSGASIDLIEKLMGLYERWEHNQARKAYDAAIADARAEMPVIKKNRHVGFDSRKPGAARTDYWHEDFAEVARTVSPVLGKHGLSFRFRTTSLLGEPVRVTCIVSHRLGYSEENTLEAGRDDSGNKNAIQAVGSTVTYLQRYTLKAALGLAASEDDDGRASGGDTGTITAEQVEKLQLLIVEVAADIPRFCKHFKIERLEEMPAREFNNAVAALEAKRERSK